MDWVFECFAWLVRKEREGKVRYVGGFFVVYVDFVRWEMVVCRGS